MHESTTKSFIFNKKIDAACLFALYEDDLPYIEEIFSITLTQLRQDIPLLRDLATKANTAALRTLVHKLKPSFAFVGMTDVQHQCAAIEQMADSLQGRTVPEEKIHPFLNMLTVALEDVEAEYLRIKEYNLSNNG